jgi:signal transduction histidine kinase
MQPLLHRRQQKLALSAPDVIPLVYADAARLTQVLVNLLANASKYGPIGQTIDLEVQSAGDGQVRVAVADRGPGLSPAIREKLFRRFGRVEVVDGAEHGVGLGLWVVKVIVSEHGGTVGADERPGGGAVFWFTVPSLPQPKRA